MDWYLLQTKPNGHSKAYENLKRQGFSVFLPLITKTFKKNGKFLDYKVPLFPGYIFMGSSINPIPWKSVNATRSISKVVTLDGVYRPINKSIIEGLKYRCDKNGIIQRLDEIMPGDRIKIERGPFSDFICNVGNVSEGNRAWVLIKLLNQQTRVEIPLSSITKVI